LFRTVPLPHIITMISAIHHNHIRVLIEGFLYKKLPFLRHFLSLVPEKKNKNKKREKHKMMGLIVFIYKKKYSLNFLC
jgi:hypothetical protein